MRFQSQAILARCGLLIDDGKRGLVGRMQVTFSRAERCETRITLTDVPEVST